MEFVWNHYGASCGNPEAFLSKIGNPISEEKEVLYMQNMQFKKGEFLMDRINPGIFRKDSAFRFASQMKGPYLFTLCQTFVPSLLVKWGVCILVSGRPESPLPACSCRAPWSSSNVRRLQGLENCPDKWCLVLSVIRVLSIKQWPFGPVRYRSKPLLWSSHSQFHPSFLMLRR